LGCSKRIKDPVQAVKRAIRRAKIRVPQRSVMGFTMKKNGSDKKHPFCISLLMEYKARNVPQLNFPFRA
jgi:hypothetical protein